MRHLNDNIFQNIEKKYKQNTKLYSNKDIDSGRIKKDPLEIDEKEEIAIEFT